MEYKSAQKQLIKIFQIWNRTSSYKKVIYQPKITFKQGHYIKIPYFHEFSKKKNYRYCNKNFLKRLHISYSNCINFLNIHFHICSLNTNTYTLTTKINVKVICTCESSLNNSNVHVYTHKLHTCIHQSHKTSLDIFSSFILIAYAHNNDKKNLIGKFQSEIYLRWLFSLRNSMFLSDYNCFPLECSWKKAREKIPILLQIFFLFKMSTTQLHVRETSGEL